MKCPLALASIVSLLLVACTSHATNQPAVQNNGPKTPALADLPLQPSVTQYGITWTFAQPAHVGQFVNGDFYVVGPVTVVKIDPMPRYGNQVASDELDSNEENLPVARRARNGSMLNVPPLREVAWDSGIKNFFNPKWEAHLPVAMHPGDTLASSISLKVGEVPEPAYPFDIKPASRMRAVDDNSPTKIAALLTCVDKPLPPDAFRPGYCGHEPKIYLARDLHRELLLHLPRVPGKYDPVKFAEVLQRPWLDTAFFSFDEPMENMPHYGQAVCQAISDAALMVNMDFTPEQKERLLINLVQIGIDHYSAVREGHPGWWAWGGFGSGRKFPIVFAGVMLGDDAMANVSKTFPKTSFGEDEMTAYGECWTGAKVVFTGHSGIDTATGIGRGVAERGNPWGPYEHLPPSKWNIEQHRSEMYRRANTSCCWVGEALAVRLMKLEKVWGHDAFFDYVDRWMNEDDKPACREIVKYFPDKNLTDPNEDWCQEGYAGDDWVNDPWIKLMWAKYRSLNPAPQNGWQQKHDESYYQNAVAKMRNK
jgi:hypothetical protein